MFCLYSCIKKNRNVYDPGRREKNHVSLAQLRFPPRENGSTVRYAAALGVAQKQRCSEVIPRASPLYPPWPLAPERTVHTSQGAEPGAEEGEMLLLGTAPFPCVFVMNAFC